ncbi:VTT domain-containing protein [Dongia soli]|uniref:Phospholipase D n=1 Tax=Dongia soli TaxID=600628 RepID=A0ABU5EGQ5_9PROT|nr:VTT domain-containing protein [Dongia soli]MDY0884613.1 VTT domain-containing protein [Dongia soli]
MNPASLKRAERGRSWFTRGIIGRDNRGGVVKRFDRSGFDRAGIERLSADNDFDSSGDIIDSRQYGDHCLQPKRNVWRITKAERAAVLVDAANYFSALRDAMLRAERTIYIAGWDVDSRTPLLPPETKPEDGLPTQLGPFLTALATRRPELSIKILLWNYAVIYAPERESMPALSLRWSTPPQVDLCLDDCVPLASSHHQKIVVIDDKVAFCGGLDLTIRRWDTCAHLPVDSRRTDPYGKSYPPFHDVQLAVSGETARHLGDLVRGRWQCAAKETLPRPEDTGSDPWPDRLRPDFCDVTAGIARTRAAFLEIPETREIEMLFRDMVAAAQRHLYIESQYATHSGFAECLAKAMQTKPELEAVIVTPKEYAGWIENMAMTDGRQRFVDILRDAGVRDRVALCHPHISDDASAIDIDVKIHSKVMIVDDRYLRVGSANLCNRSMGSDTECDLVLVAESEEQRAMIGRIRNRLMGEHCGAEAAEMGGALEKTGSMLRAIDNFHESHCLEPIPDLESDLPGGMAAAAIADPPRPIDPLLLLQPASTESRIGKSGIGKGAGRRHGDGVPVSASTAGDVPPSIEAETVQKQNSAPNRGTDSDAGGKVTGRFPPAAAGKSSEPRPSNRRGLFIFIGLMVLTVVMGLAWSYTPLSSVADAITDPSRLRPWLAAHDQGGNSLWALLAVVAIFIIAGFIAFPVVVLIAATAVAFGAWPGALYAILGAMISAVSTYIVGWWLGPDLLRHTFGPHLNRINESLRKRGILAVTVARMMPVAPFTVVNLAAGGLRIPALDFVLGTMLGLLPGVLVMSILGDRVITLVREPNLFNLSLLALLFLASIVLAIALQKLAARLRAYFG